MGLGTDADRQRGRGGERRTSAVSVGGDQARLFPYPTGDEQLQALAALDVRADDLQA